jgi:hypothetical protein
LLIATIILELDIPAKCWTAPEIAQATYKLGETVLPVWPTCSLWGLQPASTTALEAPTAPPSASARFSTKLKFSGSFSPRPPETTISASATSNLPSFLAMLVYFTELEETSILTSSTCASESCYCF